MAFNSVSYFQEVSQRIMTILKTKSAIVCDLARTEQGGKHFLIGIYSGDIVLPQLPSALRLYFWIEFEPKEIGETILQVKIQGPGSKKAYVAEAQVNIDDLQKSAVLSIPSPGLVFEKEGDLRLSIREGGEGKWKKIIGKKVRVDPDNPYFNA